MKTSKASCADISRIWNDNNNIDEFLKQLEDEHLLIENDTLCKFVSSKEKENVYLDKNFILKIKDISFKLASYTDREI